MTLNVARLFPEGIGKWAVSHYGLALLLTLSMTMNGLLAWRALYWRNRVQQAEAGQNGSPQDPLAAMTTLPALKGKHLDGSEAVVEFRKPGVPTLLYVMSPSCSWCTRNLNNLRALIDQSKNKYRVVAISVTADGLTEYAAKNRLTGPQVELVFNVSEDVLRTQALTSTPQTLLVSPEGKLIKRWQGAYVVSQAEIEKTLGVQLPGVTESP